MENKKKKASSIGYTRDFSYGAKSNLSVNQFGERRDPELIEKFYKQILNSFGYAYSAKL